MSKSKKDIIEILDRHCLSALKSNNDKTFFLCVADYVKFANNNSESNYAIRQLLEEKSKEYEIQDEYKNKTVKEIKEVLDKLKLLAVKNNAIKEKVAKIFLENEKYERGEMISDGFDVDRLFGYAKRVGMLLKNGGKGKLVSHHPKTDLHSQFAILARSISESYYRYSEENDLIKYKSNFILGNEWNNLIWVYNILNDAPELLKTMDELKNKNMILGLTYYDRYKEMSVIMKEKKDDTISFFKREEHQRSLIRINNYLSQELLSGNQKKLLKKNQLDITIPAEGEPIKNIKICKRERKFYILINNKKPFDLPVRNADEKNKTRYWDLILSIAENNSAELDPPTTSGILSYLNTGKLNPLVKVFGAQQWLEVNSDFLYPCNGVKIEIMTDAIRKKYFKR